MRVCVCVSRSSGRGGGSGREAGAGRSGGRTRDKAAGKGPYGETGEGKPERGNRTGNRRETETPAGREYSDIIFPARAWAMNRLSISLMSSTWRGRSSCATATQQSTTGRSGSQSAQPPPSLPPSVTVSPLPGPLPCRCLAAGAPPPGAAARTHARTGNTLGLRRRWGKQRCGAGEPSSRPPCPLAPRAGPAATSRAPQASRCGSCTQPSWR